MPVMAPPNSGGQVDPNSAQAAPPAAVQSFNRSAREHVEPFDDRTIQMVTSAVNVGPIDVPAYGFLRHIWVQVDATGGTGGSAVAREDAPWNALDQIQLTDVNGTQLVGPIAGYDLYLINKYGGYTFQCDPRNGPNFLAVSANGNFNFAYRIPVEIAQRDALGALPNQNSASTYKVAYNISASTVVFSTPPATTLPALRVRMWLEAWTQPAATDMKGAPQATVPPSIGTTQMWSKTVVTISSGLQTVRFPRVGNLLRTLILVNRDTTPVRSTTNFPDPAQMQLDGRILLNEGRIYWQTQMTERYDYAGVAGGSAVIVQLDTGVFVWDFTHDLDYKPGNELRDLYIPTTQATRLELQGTFGAAGTLTILTNDVAPNGDVYA